VPPLDSIELGLPGGGGVGNPFERDPQRVLDDVLDGLVSIEDAKRDYGVVIANGAIDEAATRKARG
jgi:N-methylhydantoinase B